MVVMIFFKFGIFWFFIGELVWVDVFGEGFGFWVVFCGVCWCFDFRYVCEVLKE